MSDNRTISQNKKLYWLLNELGLKDSVGDLVADETNGRTRHTSELTFIECMNLIRRLEQYIHTPQEKSASRKNSDRLDRKRKGVMKAIFAYGELLGQKWTMDYVKRIAARAGGKDSFNDLTEGDLSRIYNEFCRKQAAARTRREIEDDLSAGHYMVDEYGNLLEMES